MILLKTDILGSIGLLVLVFVGIYVASGVWPTILKMFPSKTKKMEQLERDVWELKEKLRISEREKDDMKRFKDNESIRAAIKEIETWINKNKLRH